tara:strand:+ start:12512 stop:12718 length:207 start_codon:yes stop_codon:yes gene_type:complete
MSSQRAGHQNIAHTTLNHMRQYISHVFNNDIDIQVQHTIDGIVICIHQIPTNIQSRVGVKNIDYFGFL